MSGLCRNRALRMHPIPPRLPLHAAQHDSLVTSRLNDWAASRSASDMVRYGAHVSAGPDTVIPVRIAYTRAE